MRALLVVLALAMIVLSGCGQGLLESVRLSALVPNATEIEYRFSDSTVAPEYHRSYTVTARSDDASIVVDSYGDALHEARPPPDLRLSQLGPQPAGIVSNCGPSVRVRLSS